MRVGTMAWSSHMLSTGSRDRAILQRDIRAPEDFQHALRGHRSEVGRLLYLLHSLPSASAQPQRLQQMRLGLRAALLTRHPCFKAQFSRQPQAHLQQLLRLICALGVSMQQQAERGLVSV